MATKRPAGALVALCLMTGAPSGTGVAQPAEDVVGLWLARATLRPAVRGRLILEQVRGEWRASLAGRSAPARSRGDSVTFELPGDAGSFRGRVLRVRGRASRAVGHWYARRTAAPVTLTECGSGCLQGAITTPDEALTFYLRIARGADGALRAFLRNPERNLGGGPWLPVRSVLRTADSIALLDRNARVVAAGAFRDGVMRLVLRGRSFDFERLADSAYTDFYPRGRPRVPYAYVPPRLANDGWPVARLRDVGIVEDSITRLVQMLSDLPIDSANTPQTHALLVARHGRLVLEEYFHGEDADAVHDTRSASKTHVSALIGAAMQAGVRLAPAAPVYATLRPDARDLTDRKRAVTLEHLLTMSGGFDCNDSGNRPGDEDVIADQDTNPDWTTLFLSVGMVRAPGDSAVYCSMEPYLAGLMLQQVARRPLEDLFRDLIAEPLDYGRYTLSLTPLGDVYFGGGHRFVARDFLKLPQLYLNGGTWRGRRIVSPQWIARSIEPRYRMGSRGYGYLWWTRDYAYRGRMIKAYMQLGNGSQNAIFIPELDLAIATFGANYNSPTINVMINEIIPRYLLPAVAP